MKKIVLIILITIGFQNSYSQILGTLVSISPDSAMQGQTLMTTITAQAGTFATASPPCSYQDVYIQQGTYTIISNSINVFVIDEVEAEYTIPPGAPLGYYDVYMGSGHYDFQMGMCFNFGSWVLANGFRVIGTTGVSELNQNENSVTFYPNPFTDNAYLNFKNANKENYKLTIMDSYGRKVREEILNSDNAVISSKDFATGIYFYRLEGMKNNFLFNGKFILTE